MTKTLQIRLGDFRPIGEYTAEDIDYKRGDYVILEVERGSEYGEVVGDRKPCPKEKSAGPQGKILRMATPEDLKQIEHNRLKAKEATSACVKKVADCKLEMQIVKSEYAFDASKVIFYFTADGRVDFRDLVKDLARIFKVRIELKQIGVRDKAKIIGGMGLCGRALCCSSYMEGFHPLSIKMSKDQGLPLNPSRISGVCGRIKCCMAYEFSVYREYAKDLPKMGQKINTPQGAGKVIDVNILKRIVSVDLGEGKFIKQSFVKTETRV